MASLLRRSKSWDSFVPPPGFERPRTAELKFLSFFASRQGTTWWHPTEVATCVGSDNCEAARQLCLKLAASGWLHHEVCYVTSRGVVNQVYALAVVSEATAYDKSALAFVTGFRKTSKLSVAYENGELLGMFRIAKSNRQPVVTRILEYLVEHPEPVSVEYLIRVIRSKGGSQFLRGIAGLIRRRCLEPVDADCTPFKCTYRMTASEWLKQETKRQQREEREQVKKANAARKRRRTLKKKAKKRKRPRNVDALEL